MRNSIGIEGSDFINNQRSEILARLNGSVDFVRPNSVNKILDTEDAQNFASYIDQLNIGTDSNLIVLSSSHHYYYDAEEMINVQTIINLTELNQVKQLKEFLHSVFRILPPKCTFLGCFVNNKKQNGFVLNSSPNDSYYKRNSDAIENGIASSNPLLNMIYSMIDSKTNKYLSERSVHLLLEEHGFKVTNMTEIDGLTYFCAQSLRSAEN
jgi:hypothetical protein